MSIFKAYDIRGIYFAKDIIDIKRTYLGEDIIDEETMYKIGRAFSDFISGERIVVGYDMRISSESLFDAFVRGIMKQGKNVINIGLSSTPMVYFACNYLETDGAAIITASHNSKEYNGIKLTREKAIPISEDTGIKTIERKVNNNQFETIRKRGKLEQSDVKEAYREHVLKFVKDIKQLEDRSLRIVIDAGNGMGSQDFSLVQDSLPIYAKHLYFKLDGTFPNHDANPLKKENTRTLEEIVRKDGADFGIAFDGDVDRVFFIDDNGEYLPSSFITALTAKEILRNSKKREKIIYDVRSSRIVPETIEKYEGISVIERVGHSFIKERMRNEEAAYAGEFSGHFYFRDNFYTDSAIIASIWLMNILSANPNSKLSDLIAPLRKYFASEEINRRVKDKKKKIKELNRKYRASGGEICNIDGIRADFNNWWFCVRASNTEPLLRLNLEADNPELMKEKTAEVLKIIES